MLSSGRDGTLVGTGCHPCTSACQEVLVTQSGAPAASRPSNRLSPRNRRKASATGGASASSWRIRRTRRWLASPRAPAVRPGRRSAEEDPAELDERADGEVGLVGRGAAGGRVEDR